MFNQICCFMKTRKFEIVDNTFEINGVKYKLDESAVKRDKSAIFHEAEETHAEIIGEYDKSTLKLETN